MSDAARKKDFVVCVGPLAIVAARFAEQKDFFLTKDTMPAATPSTETYFSTANGAS